jgi:cytochrome c-type biogenesis protein CcmE
MNDYEPSSHSPAGSAPAITAVQDGRPRVRRLLSKKNGALMVVVGLTCAAAGLVGAGPASAADLSSSASSPATSPTAPPTGGAPVSGPADGGATGIVDSKSTSSFTFATATGVEVTVSEDAATKYEVGNRPTSASAVKKGESVLVLGLVNSATITATQVIVQPRGDGGAAAAQAAGVIPFQQGVPSPTQSVGQIPSGYTEGQGTIVSGTTADKATVAAQAVVPGGVVDRVVELSDGEYEVHNISINWPHHVFVSKDFKVLGYE